MRYFILFSLLFCGICFAEDTKPKPAIVDTIFQKAITDNTKELERAFNAYNQALEASNTKIIKALEAAKADLNNPNKGSLSISDRAKAISDLDEKIAQVKGNYLAEYLSDNQKKVGVEKSSNSIASNLVGKWKVGNVILTFKANGTAFHSVATNLVGKWKIVKDEVIINWSKQDSNEGLWKVKLNGVADSYDGENENSQPFTMTKIKG